MLIQFKAVNHRSIKNEATLSMLASKDSDHDEHLIDAGTTDKYLKSSVIYGANGSGKSNLLHAFYFMVNYVLISHEKQLNIPTGRMPFKFDAAMLKEPSVFEVVFMVDQIKYVYGFSADDTKIINEYLYTYPKGRKAIIFERKNTNDYRFTTDVNLQMSLKERNTQNKLYLATATNWNYKKVLPVFNWFASCQVLNMRTESAYGTNGSDLMDDKYREKIAQLLHVADFGIQALTIKASANSIAGVLTDVLDNVNTVHMIKNADGETTIFSLCMAEESTGTNAYFHLVDQVEKALKTGCLLVADGIDAYLHPLLTQYLISLFNSIDCNPLGAQLIFSSHNTNFLSLDLLRRDQIWFTEKDENTGATALYSLVDFSVRKEAKVDKGYLLGRYGAIPFIKRSVND